MLARDFEAMAQNIKNKTTSIENLDREIQERKLIEAVSLEKSLFLQKLMDSIPVPVFYKDVSGVYIGCNRAFEAFFGISQKELIGKKVEELFSPEIAKIYIEKDANLFALPGIQVYEAAITNAAGESRSIMFHKATFTGASGEVQGIVGVIMDMTLRKRAEEAITASEIQLKDAQRVSHVGSWVLDLQTEQVSFSDEMFRIYGMDPEGAVPTFQECEKRTHPEDWKTMTAAIKKSEQTGEDYELELRITRQDGESRVILSRGHIQRDVNNKAVRLTGISQDITERKRAEAALQESEKRFMDVLYVSRDAILLIDGENFVDCNEATAHMLGYSTRAEFLMKHPAELSPPVQPDGQSSFVKANEMMKLAFEQGFHRFEWVHRKADGEDFPVEVSLTPVVVHGKNILHCLWRDLTELKKIESKIRQLSEAVEQSPSCIVITDKDGKIEYVNQKFSEVTGYSSAEALGQNPRILKSGEQPVEFYRDLWDTLLQGKDWQGQFSNKKKNGEIYTELAHIAPIRDDEGKIAYFVAVKEDITYRLQLEEQLRHSLRMEAVGRLAGGIAHDFNNMLTVINGYSGYLMTKMKPDDPYFDKVHQIRDAGDCAATIVRQLLNLSRKEAPKPQLIKVSEATVKMKSMIARLLGDDVELKVDHAADVGYVKMDPGQMEQVFLNLFVNARESMPKGGVLTVTTDLVRMEDIQEELRPSRKREGEFIRITVKDSGVGIDPALRKRIFEPFFTTKKKGMNTGLGLSIVYGIVEQAGGAISFESQLEKGTTFRIYLPKAKAEPGLEERSVLEVLPQGRGKILLVEDENQVREFALQVLRERGYDVRAARGGDEALGMLAEDPGRKFDLLLTDLTMPKMNGKDLVLRVREMFPELKVIFMSGYSEQMIADVEGADFLQKPFSHGQLSVKVWSVLGR